MAARTTRRSTKGKARGATPSRSRGPVNRAARPAASVRRATKTKRVPTPPTTRRPAAKTPAAGRVPNGIGLVVHHLDYTSHDVESMKHFYTGILGFRSFEHDLTMNYLTVRTSATSSIGFMPPPGGPPEQWRPPREPAAYFIVENVNQVCDELRRRGIALEQEPTNMPWGHRVAVTRDPEGRTVCLAQKLKR